MSHDLFILFPVHLEFIGFVNSDLFSEIKIDLVKTQKSITPFQAMISN